MKPLILEIFTDHIEADGPIPGDYSMACFGAIVVEPSLDRTFYGRLKPISDNNGFDWQFINWYFHHFLGKNPFGHSSTNLGSLYKGVVRDMFASFKRLSLFLRCWVAPCFLPGCFLPRPDQQS